MSKKQIIFLCIGIAAIACTAGYFLGKSGIFSSKKEIDPTEDIPDTSNKNEDTTATTKDD